MRAPRRVFGIVSVIAGIAIAGRYRRDSIAARRRVDSIDKQTVETAFGTMEFAQAGGGEPVLVVHGIFGGRDAGLLSFGGVLPGRRVIAPSRFGYLGSAMPPNPSPEAQADAFAELLDHLGLDDIDVIGYSAGATSALQLALRHPSRVRHLVIMCGNLPGRVAATTPPPVAKVAFRSDVLMWLAGVVARRPLRNFIGGVPAGFAFTDDELRRVDAVVDSIFPVGDRSQGALFDAFVSNKAVNDYPLEAVSVPALIVHSRDDTLASYDAADAAARRIPGCRLITHLRGGHLMLGQDEANRAALAAFLGAAADIAPPGRARP